MPEAKVAPTRRLSNLSRPSPVRKPVTLRSNARSRPSGLSMPSPRRSNNPGTRITATKTIGNQHIRRNNARNANTAQSVTSNSSTVGKDSDISFDDGGDDDRDIQGNQQQQQYSPSRDLQLIQKQQQRIKSLINTRSMSTDTNGDHSNLKTEENIQTQAQTQARIQKKPIHSIEHENNNHQSLDSTPPPPPPPPPPIQSSTSVVSSPSSSSSTSSSPHNTPSNSNSPKSHHSNSSSSQSFPDMDMDMDMDNEATSKIEKIADLKVQNNFLRKENQHLKNELSVLQKSIISIEKSIIKDNIGPSSLTLEEFKAKKTNDNTVNSDDPDVVKRNKEIMIRLQTENESMFGAIQRLSKTTIQQSHKIDHYKSHYKGRLHQVKLQLDQSREEISNLKGQCKKWEDSYQQELKAHRNSGNYSEAIPSLKMKYQQDIDKKKELLQNIMEINNSNNNNTNTSHGLMSNSKLEPLPGKRRDTPTKHQNIEMKQMRQQIELIKAYLQESICSDWDEGEY